MSEIYTKNAAGKQLPSVIYWTRSLRNLYQSIAIDIKEKIVHECLLMLLERLYSTAREKMGLHSPCNLLNSVWETWMRIQNK